MSEDAEQRFERALDRLFSSPASSTAEAASSCKEKRKGVPGRDDDLVGANISLTAKLPSGLPHVAGSSPVHAVSPFNSKSVCRPWDRGDLFRRLATFKSMSWFGKPEEAGPVSCARKGWVNVDVDLIACEGCHAKLSFPSLTTWSQQQVESVAAAFSKKLGSAHKALCPWKENICPESLAQFPPTPVEALMEGFRDRCDELFQLSTLPVISISATNHLKYSRGSQIDRFLAQPAPAMLLSTEMQKNVAKNGSCTYFQAQRIISLCGWEPRLLPYIVDCEDYSTMSDVRSTRITAHGDVKARRQSDPGPTVLLCSLTEKPEEKENKEKPLYTEQRSNRGSAVLDCSLCGASVGLWLFSQIARPSILTSAQSADVIITGSACGFSAASGIERGFSDDHERKENIENFDEAGEAVTSSLSVSASRGVKLDLKLTIAGGPPPTQHNPNVSVPSMFPPSPFIQPGTSLPTKNDVGNGLISNVLGAGHRGITNDKQISIMFDADTKEHASLKDNIADKLKSCAAESQQKELTGDPSPALAGSGIEKDGDGQRTRKRKRNERSFKEDLPRYSSVDAMDTCFHSRRENSIESVEMPLEADSDGTAVSGENNVGGQASERHEKSPVSSKDEQVAKDEGNDNVSTIITGSVSKNVTKAVDIGCRNNDRKCDQQTELYHDEESISRPAAEVTQKVISEERREGPVVAGGENQVVILPAHLEHRISSANNVPVMEGNFSDNGGKVEETEKQLVLLSEERMDGGQPMKLVTAEALPESSNRAGTAAEGIFDSEMVWEKETKEFDPVLQHRHFCPWVNVNFMKLTNTSDNQNGRMSGWQLTLDALEASPVIIASESASSIYNVDPLSSVRKILGRTQRSQKKSKN